MARKSIKSKSRNSNSELNLNITNKMNIIRPVITNSGITMVSGKLFTINDEQTIFVQDVCEQQNSTLFEKGINIINNKLTPKRRTYIQKMTITVLPPKDLDMDNIMEISKEITSLIAFVCDIALHDNKKLAHPQAYDKEFGLYVSNLFREYWLDDYFEMYVKSGADIYLPINPMFVPQVLQEYYKEYYNTHKEEFPKMGQTA